MKRAIAGMSILLLCGLAPAGTLPVEPATARWNPGAEDCEGDRPPPLQVHRLDAETYVLRQNPCASFEANLMYLLIGEDRALLIDSGAIAEPARMPLASTVMSLLPGQGDARLPLIVAHTHSHRDHREGDAQFASLPRVDIVPPDAQGVRRHYGLERWPEGVAQIDLGGRIVHVLPAPGHNDNHVVFHDQRTGALFTGDFLLPGRLTVDDADAFEASARRLAAFVRNRPVSQVLGGHVELDVDGSLYPHGATFHPRERDMALAKADVLALPDAMAGFNGFHATHANYVITNPKRNLALLAGAILLMLGLAVWGVVRLVRRRRGARASS